MRFCSMSKAGWWLSFYTVWDFVKGTILLLVIFALMIPFDIIAWQLNEAGTWLMLAYVIGIHLCNVIMYVRAIIIWIIFTKQYKKRMKESKINPNVDYIWQVERPW